MKILICRFGWVQNVVNYHNTQLWAAESCKIVDFGEEWKKENPSQALLASKALFFRNWDGGWKIQLCYLKIEIRCSLCRRTRRLLSSSLRIAAWRELAKEIERTGRIAKGGEPLCERGAVLCYPILIGVPSRDNLIRVRIPLHSQVDLDTT